MAIKSLQHSSLEDNIFYRSMLAGNDAYFPEFESDDFLEEVVLTSSAASVTFSGLDAYSDYKHLQIRGVSRSDKGSTIDVVKVQLNADTGSNYAYHRIRGRDSAVTSSGFATQTSMHVGVPPAATNTANVFDAIVLDLLDFSSSSKNTTIRVLEGHTAATFPAIYLFSGLWNSTAAVTSINIFSTADSFVTGSRFSLYGSKG